MLLSTEYFRHSFYRGGWFFCEESDLSAWKNICENTTKNSEVMILANVILGPKRALRL